MKKNGAERISGRYDLEINYINYRGSCMGARTRKPEDLGNDVTMEDVCEEFLDGNRKQVLERVVGIIEDTQNQYKRGSQCVDVCFNLEIVKLMITSRM